MITWVMYDIVKDRARNRVAKYCKQAGLFRVQYSVFLGKIDKGWRDTLRLQIEGEINPLEDKVYIFPMSKAELKQTILLGQAFNKKMVNKEFDALFF